MTDKEIRRFVKQLLISGFEEHKTHSENINKVMSNSDRKPIVEQFGVAMPLCLEMIGSEDADVFDFYLTLPNDPGGLEVLFSPQPYIENYVKTNYQKFVVEQKVPLEFFREKIRGDLAGKIKMFILNFGYEMAEAANLQMLLIEKIQNFLTADDFVQKNDSAAQAAQVDKILEFANRGRRQRIINLKKAQYRSLTAPKYLFSVVFEERLKVWKQARLYYKQNKTFDNWRDGFKAVFTKEFADFGFSDDLIDRLTLRGASEPKILALEDTQRILEIPTKKVAERTLHDFLKESEIEAKNIPQDKIEHELKDFLDYKKRRDARDEQVSEMLLNYKNSAKLK